MILVIGDANVDLSAAIDAFPREGEESQVRRLLWGSGGSAANVAAGLALLGARVQLWTRVGDDPWAEIALRVARAAGVDLRAVERDRLLPTGCCFAAVSPSGERTFFTARGANLAFQPSASLPAEATWLHVSAYALLEGPQRRTAARLVEEAKGRGVPISLDLGMLFAQARREEALELSRDLAIVFGNQQEMEALLPGTPVSEVGRQLVARGAGLAVTKLGPRGCEATSRQGEWTAAAFPVAARDTTGCGDAFVAGYLWAHWRGATCEDCATVANALGALTAARSGSAHALPDLAALSAFLSERAAPGLVERLLG
jgi:sugar/nucleoside kinase (ribokinase family)